MSNVSEQAIVYAALILQDDNVEITSEKLLTLTKAAGVDVEPIWASIFAKALAGKDLGELLMNVGAGKFHVHGVCIGTNAHGLFYTVLGAAAAPAAGAAAGGAAAGGAAEEAKEEEKEEEEESDEDMGFGLFD
jgi:large subunit ribosomal protein LP1